jgi:hypothetical protein
MKRTASAAWQGDLKSGKGTVSTGRERRAGANAVLVYDEI